MRNGHLHLVGCLHTSTRGILCSWLGCLLICVTGKCGLAQNSEPLFSFHQMTVLGTASHLYPCVRIQFGDHNAIALIDTGSTKTLLDSTWEQRLTESSLLLGDRTQRRLGTAGNSISCIDYNALRFSINDKEVNSLGVSLIDFQNVKKALNSEVAVVLGYEFLRSGALGYSRSTNEFYLGRKLQHSVGDKSILRLSDDKSAVSIDVRLSWLANDTKFFIDTGDRWPLGLDKSLFSEGISNGSIVKVRDSFQLSLAGKEGIRFGEMPILEVFGSTFKDVLVNEGNGNRIGLGLLRRLDFEIDFISKEIHVGSNVDVSTRFVVDVSGVTVGLREKSVEVLNNLGFASGPVADLMAGDIIVKWDDSPITGEDIESIKVKLLDYPSTIPICIVVKRRGEVTELR